MTAGMNSETGASPAAGRGLSEEGPELPVQIIDRSAARQRSAAAGRSRLLSYPAFALVIAVSVAVGGIVGLYGQPPGLQWVMRASGLEPGAGSNSPIAVPVRQATGGTPASAAIEASHSPESIVALGRLLPQGEVIEVATSSGVRDARIENLEVTEGDRIEAGQIIAVLDNERRLLAAVDSAGKTVALREAALVQTRSDVRASEGETRASLAGAEASLVAARQDYVRIEQLIARGYATTADHIRMTANLTEAEYEVERLRARLLRYSADRIDDQADVVVAQRNLDAARAELQRAREDLQQAYVRAPITGRILEVHARPGEKPGEDGVVSIGNTDIMIARLEVYQTLIGRIAVGDPVELSADALPQPLNGHIGRLGLQVKRQSVVDDDPAANTDARVVEVIVRFDQPSSRIASKFTNLQVEGRILAGEQR